MSSGPTPRGTIARRLRRALCNPAATVLCLLLLGWEVGALPPGGSRWASSTASTLLFGRRRGHTMGGPSVQAFFVRDGGALRVILTDEESADEVSRLLVEHPDRLFEADFEWNTTRTGLWALTHEVKRRILTFSDFGSPPSDDERKNATELFASRLDQLDRGPLAIQVRQGNQTSRRVLWAGYAHDVLAAAAAGGFLLSLGWLPYVPARLRDRRRRRAESRGQCPRCGYTLRGLPPNDPCPECGTTSRTAPETPAALTP